MRTSELFSVAILAAQAVIAQIDARDSCPAGSVHMSGFSLPGGSFDVCCPGSSVHQDDVEYCCVGGGNHDRRVKKRVDICIGGPADCSSTADATASCATAVPATAGDFSDRVASATKTMDSQASGQAQTASPSRGVAGSAVTAAIWPAFVAAAGGAVVNAACMA